MRFAGQFFSGFPHQEDTSAGKDFLMRIEGMQESPARPQSPVVPGFNTEDLAPTPELPAGTPFNQKDKGRYIQQNPGSGISSLNDSFGLVGQLASSAEKGPDAFYDNFGLVGQVAKGNAKNSFGLVGQLLG